MNGYIYTEHLEEVLTELLKVYQRSPLMLLNKPETQNKTTIGYCKLNILFFLIFFLTGFDRLEFMYCILNIYVVRCENYGNILLYHCGSDL